MNFNNQIRIKWKNLNFEKIKLGKVKNTIKIFYEDDDQIKDLIIQLPHLFSPFGAKKSDYLNWQNQEDYYINANLKNINQQENFQQFLKNLNSRICYLINQHDFFKVQCQDAEFLFKKNSNPQYQDLCKLNFRRNKNGVFDSFLFKRIFDQKSQKFQNISSVLDEDNIENDLKKGCVFMPSIQCSKIYYYKEKFGAQWEIDQILLLEQNKEQINQIQEIQSCQQFSVPVFPIIKE